MYPSLRAVIGGNGFSEEAQLIIRDHFFMTEPSDAENVTDMIEYFSRQDMSDGLKGVVSSVATFKNFELILRLLNLTREPSEFMSLFMMQASTK